MMLFNLQNRRLCKCSSLNNFELFYNAEPWLKNILCTPLCSCRLVFLNNHEDHKLIDGPLILASIKYIMCALPFLIFLFCNTWLWNAGVRSCGSIFLRIFCKSWKSDNVARWGHRYSLWSALKLMSLSLFSIFQICVLCS